MAKPICTVMAGKSTMVNFGLSVYDRIENASKEDF
jgi:hypothetical protein